MESDDDLDKTIADLEQELAQAKAARRQRAGGTTSESWRRGIPLAGLVGGSVGALGFCFGMGSALTAVFPSSALWTSVIVCGGPGQLIANTRKYSYKPGQSGTSTSFHCLDGSSVGWFPITALQTLPVIAVLAVGVAVVLLTLRRRSAAGGR